MGLLGSSADPNVDQVEKMMDDSDKNNVQGHADVKGDIKGEELDGFVSAQLEASAPRTMDKAMLQLNLEKPKVGGRRIKDEI